MNQDGGQIPKDMQIKCKSICFFFREGRSGSTEYSLDKLLYYISPSPRQDKGC